ncbi:MAG: nucleotidyl transferase AbiEii/AbiGii toxin family protein, partial [Coriobacteriia bacterium]|nr:nucleotidyl transferase AbiEii/AbiGii toxin family protein [Coriobacteriia bacterium]
MSQRELKNIPASVRARLLSEAKASGDSYDQVLQYFAIERFLYRLSKTEWGERLIVKGAIMLRAWGTPLGRPTRDIDFLGNIDNSPQAVGQAVQECLAVEYQGDGIVFDPDI